MAATARGGAVRVAPSPGGIRGLGLRVDLVAIILTGRFFGGDRGPVLARRAAVALLPVSCSTTLF